MATNKKIELLGISELCSVLGICKNTAYKLISENKLKAFKIGRHWKVPQDSIEKYISKQIS